MAGDQTMREAASPATRGMGRPIRFTAAGRVHGEKLDGARSPLPGPELLEFDIFATSAAGGWAAQLTSWAQHALAQEGTRGRPAPPLATLSISTSPAPPLVTPSAPPAAPSASHSSRRRPRAARPPTPWFVTMSLPAVFQQAQRCAKIILGFYRDKGEAFPRPCPVCGECDFMEPCESHGAHALVKHDHRLGQRVTSDKPNQGGDIAWGSRPLACDQCHRWWHLGCLGINTLDDLPPSPWFHSKECRHTYLAMEAQAEAGELPAWELAASDPLHPGADALSVEVMTDADHRSFVMGAFGGGRGDMAAAYDLLSNNFNSEIVLGYGAESLEFAGGKYAMLLRSRGMPVAVATFDVYGHAADRHAAGDRDQQQQQGQQQGQQQQRRVGQGTAQLHLLATAKEQRGQGHARALLDVLESRLAQVGCTRLVAQPRQRTLDMFTGSLGWEVMHPLDAAQLHTEIPIAFFDAVLVEKQL